MKLTIDTHTCTGHGRCYYYAPDLVTSDDRGYGEVIEPDADVSEEFLPQARRVVQTCPERAISLN